MIVYLLLAVLPLLLTFEFPRYRNDIRQKKRYYFCLIIVYVFFVGFRSVHLGSKDTAQYVSSFLNAANSTDLFVYLKARAVMETGFNIFEWVLSHVFPFGPALLIVSATVCMVAICSFADKNSNNPALTISLFITIELFLFTLQGLRQSIAMAVCIFAYEQVKKRKIIRFSTLVLLATTFHRSAVVFFFVYFLYGIKVSRNRVLLYVPISVVLFLVSDSIINLANKVFSYGSINRVYNGAVEGGGYITLLIHVGIVVFSLLYVRQFNIDETGNTNCMLFYVSFISLICFSLRYFGAREAERMSFYFSFAQLALLPNTLSYVKGRERQVIEIVVFFGTVILFVSKLINNNFLPYQFFWNN